MSTFKMFFAGSGGQGVILMGQMVTHAAMLDDKQSTFFPSYGPEMRGGTASCTVVVSDKTVSCPVINEADFVVAMNLPSFTKFEPMLKPGGIILFNSSMVNVGKTRGDVTAVSVPVNDLATELGNTLVANMIMLGAFIRVTNVVSEASVKKIIDGTIGKKKAELLEINMKAFDLWVPEKGVL